MERLQAAAAANFTETVRMWGAAPTSRMKLYPGCVLVSTGVAIADQNYAIPLEGGSAGECMALSTAFFRGLGMPFTLWSPPGGRGEGLSAEIEAAGMPRRCSPPAMARPLAGTEGRGLSPLPRGLELVRASSPEEAREWGNASLEGFGSGPEHSESFGALASSLVAGRLSSSFRLLTLRLGGRAAATSMLSIAGETAGLYYFSVAPAFRRRGLGMLLLGASLEEAARCGGRVAVLQASPMGRPLYLAAGFVECGRYRVHSPDPDAC